MQINLCSQKYLLKTQQSRLGIPRLTVNGIYDLKHIKEIYRMKLKPIVAAVSSMFFIGLIAGGSAYADVSSDSSAVQPQLDAMQAKLAQMQAIIDQNSSGTGIPTSPDWFNMISVSGLINVDGIWSNRTPQFVAVPITPFGPTVFAVNHYGPGHSTDLQLSNADLFVDAQVNDWTAAHIGLNFQDNQDGDNFDNSVHTNNTDDSYSRSQIISAPASPILDEGYITFGNFTQSPIYFRVGRQYVNFGDYDRYAVVPTFTQLLTETNETAATLGFVDVSGINASLFGFRGAVNANQFVNTQRTNNYGANIGIANNYSNFGYNFQASYLYNIDDVDFIDQSYTFPLVSNAIGPVTLNKVGGMSVDGRFNTGPWDFAADYFWALQSFNPGAIAFVHTNGNISGASPRALYVGAGYCFYILDHTSRLGLDYQRSWQAVAVGVGPVVLAAPVLPFGFGAGTPGLPKQRYEGNYTVNVSKNTDVGLDLFDDRDYGTNQGGTGKSAFTGVVRVGVKFA